MSTTEYVTIASLTGSGQGNYDVVKIYIVDESTITFNAETANPIGAGIKFIIIGY